MRYFLKESALPLAVVLILTASLGAQNVNVPQALVRYPDTILYNGKVVPMTDRGYNTNLGPIAQAIAITDDKIFMVGSDKEMLALAGPKTQKIDVKGHTVIPGIVNAHTHIHDAAVTKWMDRQYAKDKASLPVAVFKIQGKNPEELKHDVIVTLKEKTSDLRPGQWIFLNMPNQQFEGTYFIQDHDMSTAELDKLMPKGTHPVLMNAHPAYMMNEEAERKLEETYDAKHPREEYDESVFGSRIVEFRRMSLIDDYFKTRIPELADILQDEMMSQAAAGITSFSSHITGARYQDAYMKLVREHKMPIRFAYTNYMGGLFNPGMEVFAARMGDMSGLGDENDFFWLSGISASAIDSGPPMICTTIETNMELKKREWCRLEFDRYAKFLENGLKNHVRVVVGHNYGDKGLDQYIALLDDLVKTKQATLEDLQALKLSTDHCGVYPRPDQIPILKKYNMFLSCGSNVLTRSYPWIEKYGLQYAKWVAPVKSALDGGVKVVFESEQGVLQGIFGAFTPFITRLNAQGKPVALDEAVDRNIVMKMATTWSSEFVLKPDKVGTLEKGKLADVLVLNQDYFTVPVDQIYKTYPVITLVGGKIEYVRSDAAPEFGLQPVGNQIRYDWETGKKSGGGGGE